MAHHMAALMQTPSNQSDSTVIGHGRTLPDISLGSLGSSFRSDDEENGPARMGVGGARPQVARSGYTHLQSHMAMHYSLLES